MSPSDAEDDDVEAWPDMPAYEYIVVRPGNGTAFDREAPAMYSPGLDKPLMGRSPAPRCCVWAMEWSDGAAVVACLPAEKYPQPSHFYELTINNLLFVGSIYPLNRLPA